MADFSSIDFRKTWRDHPENLLLASMPVLCDGMNCCNEAKLVAVAELFVRVFLSDDRESEPARIINQLLPNGELDDFMALFSGPAFRQESLDGQLWNAQNDFSARCETAVRKRFRRLFTTDGLIPVYSKDGSGNAYLIPFAFEAAASRPGVFDLDGHEIPEWSDCLNRLGIEQSARLHFYLRNSFPLEGSSLMLPLQMAWWRKKGKLPEYNVFRLVATGSFDNHMTLAEVATQEKAQAVLAQLHDASFVFPECNINVTDKRGFHPLKLGIGRDSLLEKLRRIAERLDRLDLQYAMQRIDTMGREVRLYNYSNWDELIERLKNARVFDRRQNPDSYLVNLMLLSEACCHAGRNEESKKLNRRARDFAASHDDKYVKLLLRLEIENLVNKTDDTDLAEAAELGRNLLEALKRLKDTDLWMRYHGTMGQIYVYGTLQNLPGFRKEKAKEHFEKAIDCAYKLEVNAEIAHDLNYRHLYYAVFAPGTDEDQDAYEEALNKQESIQKEEQKQGEYGNAERNLYYLKRTQAMAWYRLLLMNGQPPEYETRSFHKMLLDTDQGAEDWLRCCAAKYLGALEAASGNMESAEKLFKKSVTAIAPEKTSGIKSLIRFSALAEAYRSLRKEEYRDDALALLNGAPSLLHFAVAKEFKDFLTGDAPFPGLKFWY